MSDRWSFFGLTLCGECRPEAMLAYAPSMLDNGAQSPKALRHSY